MRTLVKLFPKQKIAGSNLVTICSSYYKNEIEYQIFFKVRENRMLIEVCALDSALSISGFTRINIRRLSERVELIKRSRIGALDYRIGYTIEKTIVGYNEDGKWNSKYVRNESKAAYHAFYCRMAYEDGAININNK